MRREDFQRKERLDTVLKTTIPSQHKKLGEYGILESLKLPQPPPPLRFPRHQNGFTVQVFWDSDVGKWIEAASYALSHRRDADIEAKIEAIVDDFEKAQEPDGYLNCWYLGREPDKRWTNLRDNHEMYNAGHLLEGAVAYFQVTGRRRFLDIMERYLDHIYATFGTGPGQRRGYDGHEEIELALMKLYYLTGDKKHLDFAAYLINERGQQPPHYFDVEREAREGGDSSQRRFAQRRAAEIGVDDDARGVDHRPQRGGQPFGQLAARLGDKFMVRGNRGRVIRIADQGRARFVQRRSQRFGGQWAAKGGRQFAGSRRAQQPVDARQIAQDGQRGATLGS